MESLESKIRDRFFAKVRKDDNGCLLWTGASNGYGRFNIGGRQVEYAHRVAWFLEKGVWSKLNLCHSCDTRLCVNTDHLFEGTDKDNIHDALRKGRPFGRPNNLTPDQRDKIRLLLEQGHKQRDVARMFRVAQATVSECKRFIHEPRR